MRIANQSYYFTQFQLSKNITRRLVSYRNLGIRQKYPVQGQDTLQRVTYNKNCLSSGVCCYFVGFFYKRS